MVTRTGDDRGVYFSSLGSRYKPGDIAMGLMRGGPPPVRELSENEGMIYALIWSPKRFDSFQLKPFIAVNEETRLLLLDAESRTRIAEREYSIPPNSQEIMKYIGRFSAVSPHDLFNAARTVGARKSDYNSTFLSMTEDQRRILEDTYKGMVKFVKIKDRWADPILLDPLSVEFAEAVEEK